MLSDENEINAVTIQKMREQLIIEKVILSSKEQSYKLAHFHLHTWNFAKQPDYTISLMCKNDFKGK